MSKMMKLFVGLIVVDVVLVLLHTLFGWSLVNLDQEANLSAWYSSVKLFVLACLAWRNYALERRLRPVARFRMVFLWLVVGGIFLFLSADETSSMHERLARVVMAESAIGLDIRETLLAGDATKDSFAWVLLLAPFILAVVVLFVVFFGQRFRRMPGVLIPALVGVGMFVSAVGCEATIYVMPSFQEWSNADLTRYNLGIALEESGEIFGATLFILALGRYGERLLENREQGGATR